MRWCFCDTLCVMKLPRPLVALAVVSGTIGIAACAPAPRGRPIPTTPIEGGIGSLQEARKYLEGRWVLLSFEVFPPGAEPMTLAGTGVLTYDDFSNLSVEIRTDEATAGRLEEAGIEMQGGVISTEGRTAIDLQARTLTYVIAGQPAVGRPSGPLAMNRPRYWEVDGNVLTLTTRDDSGNALSVAKWRKEP
jgi:hypothetical protein